MDISSFPEPVAAFLRETPVYDSSCSNEAKVYYLGKDGGYFLKVASSGSLQTEASMTKYFHELGLSAEVIYFGGDSEKDYLITRRIPGEDCTDRMYLDDPKKLCDTTAGLLRQLHENKGLGCPVDDRLKSYIAAVAAMEIIGG